MNVSVSSRSRRKLERSRFGLVSNKLSNVSVSKEKVSFASLSSTLLDSYRIEAVCCMLTHVSSISAISSAKSKLHKCASSDHVMLPVVLSVVFDTQSIVIANSSGDKIHSCRTPVSTGNRWLKSPSTLTAEYWFLHIAFTWRKYFSLVFRTVHLPECWSINIIKGFAKVDEIYYYLLILFLLFASVRKSDICMIFLAS